MAILISSNGKFSESDQRRWQPDRGDLERSLTLADRKMSQVWQFSRWVGDQRERLKTNPNLTGIKTMIRISVVAVLVSCQPSDTIRVLISGIQVETKGLPRFQLISRLSTGMELFQPELLQNNKSQDRLFLSRSIRGLLSPGSNKSFTFHSFCCWNGVFNLI